LSAETGGLVLTVVRRASNWVRCVRFVCHRERRRERVEIGNGKNH
jgi:hypothetical protein